MLLRRIGEGDRDAYATIVREYGNVVWTVVRSFRLDYDDRNEVFQITFIRLLEHSNRIREADRLAAWLATVARNECRRLLRVRETPIDLRDMPERTFDPEPTQRLTDQYERAALAMALDEMPTKCQQLLRLLFGPVDLDYQTISDIMGIPIGSIGPTRARCLDQLRNHPNLRGIRVEG